MQPTRIQVGDVPVEDGAGQGHRPEAGRESLVGHGGGDPVLGGPERRGDLADAEAQRVGVNVGDRVLVHRRVGVRERRGGRPCGCGPRDVQDGEGAERAEGGEGGVEVHGQQYYQGRQGRRDGQGPQGAGMVRARRGPGPKAGRGVWPQVAHPGEDCGTFVLHR
ncbi:hypothetical protein TPA0905_26700 [Streptomyces olivaceus]|nr:hypothetical protein TPA0905_26700 [Streptomyces olivaceus]